MVVPIVVSPHTHTPSQNSLVEHTIRHLVETMCTLLLHGHMPPKFLTDKLLTTTYITNQIPTSALNSGTSFECLFGTLPDYTSMRIFGCLCHPLHVSNLVNKLEPKSSLCAFIEYASGMKGYWCLDLQSGCVYTSWSTRHVRWRCLRFCKSHSYRATIPRPSNGTTTQNTPYCANTGLAPTYPPQNQWILQNRCRSSQPFHRHRNLLQPYLIMHQSIPSHLYQLQLWITNSP